MQAETHALSTEDTERFATNTQKAILNLFSSMDREVHQLEVKVFERRRDVFYNEFSRFRSTDIGQQIQQKIQPKQLTNLVYPHELFRTYILFEHTLTYVPSMYLQIRPSDSYQFFATVISMYTYWIIFGNFENAHYTRLRILAHKQHVAESEKILQITDIARTLNNNDFLWIRHFVCSKDMSVERLRKNLKRISRLLVMNPYLENEMKSRNIWTKYEECVQKVHNA